MTTNPLHQALRERDQFRGAMQFWRFMCLAICTGLIVSAIALSVGIAADQAQVRARTTVLIGG